MGNAVRRLEDLHEVVQDYATVVEVGERTVVYEGDRGRRRSEARVAAACLLSPKVGDRVLVAERGETAYVLTVLERADDEATAELRIDGDVSLEVSGRLRMRADEGVEIVSRKALSLLSSAFNLRSADGEVAIDRMRVFGGDIVANSRTAKVVSGVLESFVERVQQHVKRSYRTVEEVDQLHAKRLDYRAEEEVSLRGSHAFVHAADLVKVTGAQIHMG